MDGGFHQFNVTVVGLLRDWISQAARDLVADVDDNNTKDLDDLMNTADLLREQGKLVVSYLLLLF